MREEYSGWFVEIPTALKKKFKMLYPGRAAQKRVTLAAIEWAIKNHPSLRNGEVNVETQMQGDNQVRDSLHVQRNEERILQDSQPDETGSAGKDL